MKDDRSERIAYLEQKAVRNRNNPTGANARMDIDRILREIDDEKAADRHAEAIRESQASRRLDKWAFGVAGFSLILSAFSTWIAVVALQQRPSSTPQSDLSPASVSSEPAHHADPIPGSTAKFSTPATQTPEPAQAQSTEPNETPTSPKE